jgi:hypothetical protein
MQIIKTIGNKQLLEREKTLFLCSKHTPIDFYERIFQWTDSLTDRDCIVCFNSTEMEAEVLKTLLVAGVPTVLFVMNRFTDVNNIQIEKALEEQRMLIVILQRDEPKGKGATPRLRSMFNFTDDTSLVLQEWQGDKSLGSLYPENNSNPEWLYIIPLENIAEVSSNYALITKFQTVKTTFDISQFLSI